MPGTTPLTGQDPDAVIPQGHYINLDQSRDRRVRIERSLSEAGMSGLVERFPALSGDGRIAGITRNELGCLLSHAHLVSLAATAGEPRLILEDDAVPSPLLRVALAGALRVLGEDWDLLFLNCTPVITNLVDLRRLLQFKRSVGDPQGGFRGEFRLLDGRRWYVAGAAAYVVSARGAARIEAAIVQHAEAGHPLPIDLLYRKLIQERHITAKVLFPFLAGLEMEQPSTIGARPSFSDDLEGLGFGIETLINLLVADGERTPLLARAHEALHDPDFDVDAFILSQALYRYLAWR